MPHTKACVGVIFGGKSGEHNVSIKSAITVINGLQEDINYNKYKVIPIYIDIEGRWWGSDISNHALKKGLALETSEFKCPLPLPGFRSLPIEHDEIDIWFPVLHGPNGEDGTIQGLLKLIGKPFVGSGVLGSALGMDKISMKAAFKQAGIPQVKYISVEKKSLNNQDKFNQLINKIEDELKYPCFIKPANLGSSVGITKAINKDDLLNGINKASILDKRIIIEEGVNARELECGALGNGEIKISEVGEINLQSSDWYDYETKYSDQNASLLIPAPISRNIKEKIQRLTQQACDAISVNGIARVDFFYVEANDEIFINEINTLPGFTSTSMYPNLWKASGFTIPQLLAYLVESARK